MPSKAAAAGRSLIPVGNARCKTTLTKKCTCLPLAGCLPLGCDPEREREPSGSIILPSLKCRRSHFSWNVCEFGVAYNASAKTHLVENITFLNIFNWSAFFPTREPHYLKLSWDTFTKLKRHILGQVSHQTMNTSHVGIGKFPETQQYNYCCVELCVDVVLSNCWYSEILMCQSNLESLSDQFYSKLLETAAQ